MINLMHQTVSLILYDVVACRCKLNVVQSWVLTACCVHCSSHTAPTFVPALCTVVPILAPRCASCRRVAICWWPHLAVLST